MGNFDYDPGNVFEWFSQIRKRHNKVIKGDIDTFRNKGTFQAKIISEPVEVVWDKTVAIDSDINLHSFEYTTPTITAFKIRAISPDPISSSQTPDGGLALPINLDPRKVDMHMTIPWVGSNNDPAPGLEIGDIVEIRYENENFTKAHATGLIKKTENPGVILPWSTDASLVDQFMAAAEAVTDWGTGAAAAAATWGTEIVTATGVVSRPDCAASADPRCAILDDRGIDDEGEWEVYLIKRSQGVSPPGFWDSFRSALQTYINTHYPEIGMRIQSLGVSRDLMASISPSSSARISGSKHGAGLAQDIYFHCNLLEGGEYTSYRNDNPVIAKDQKLVNTIINFVAGYPQLRWGGSFGIQGDVVPLDTLPVDRGILEFHHFEFKSAEMPALFAPYDSILATIPGCPRAADITSSTALAQLYTALVSGGSPGTGTVTPAGATTSADSGYYAVSGIGVGADVVAQNTDATIMDLPNGSRVWPWRESMRNRAVTLVVFYHGVSGGESASNTAHPAGPPHYLGWMFENEDYGIPAAFNQLGKTLNNTLFVVPWSHAASWSNVKSDLDTLQSDYGITFTNKAMGGWSGGSSGGSQALKQTDYTWDIVYWADPSMGALDSAFDNATTHQNFNNNHLYFNFSNWPSGAGDYAVGWDAKAADIGLHMSARAGTYTQPNTNHKEIVRDVIKLIGQQVS